MNSIRVRIADCPLCPKPITAVVTHMTNGNTHMQVDHVCVTPTNNPRSQQ